MLEKHKWSNPLMDQFIKNQQTELKAISRDDLIYIACFIDCEGTIGLSRHSPKQREQYESYGAGVSITNTNRLILKSFVEITGFGKVVLNNKVEKKGYKPTHSYYIIHKEIKLLLPMLLPHLRMKQKQAELVLEFLDLPIFKGTGDGRSSIYIEQSILDRRRSIWEELRDLNKKG